MSYLLAFFLSTFCPTDTAWAERNPDGAWSAVCGNDDGDEMFRYPSGIVVTSWVGEIAPVRQ